MKVVTPPLNQIGAQILDMDVASITPAECESIKQLVYEHKLVIFREQNISDVQYVEFSRKIGTPQVYPQDNYHHPKYPEVFVSSNVLQDGKKVGVKGTGRYWHTDCAFLDEPLPWTMHPQILPNSIRETYYIDMQQVYQKLPAHLKNHVEGKYLIHDGKLRYKVQECDIDKAIIDILKVMSERFPAVRHPAVITHPLTGDKILYASSGFTTGIEGLNYETSQEVLQELLEFIERKEHVHTHTWQDGDLILWENRALNHMASTVPPGEKSVSYRIGIYDGLPFYVTADKSAESLLTS
ncbi:MAG: TauD/TfdA family dioxygenase [Cyanobacteria bacterium J06558_2]